MRVLTQEPEETYKTQAVSGSYKSWLWGLGVGSQLIHMQTHTHANSVCLHGRTSGGLKKVRAEFTMTAALFSSSYESGVSSGVRPKKKLCGNEN